MIRNDVFSRVSAARPPPSTSPPPKFQNMLYSYLFHGSLLLPGSVESSWCCRRLAKEVGTTQTLINFTCLSRHARARRRKFQNMLYFHLFHGSLLLPRSSEGSWCCRRLAKEVGTTQTLNMHHKHKYKV